MAREMKDSGIEWIGDIPKHWEIIKVKNIGEYRNGLTYSPIDLVSKDEGTLVLRSSNVQQGKLVLEDNVYVNTKIKQNLMIKQGDILICSRNGSKELIGKNTIIDLDINASFGAFMMIFRCNFPKYMYYILNSSIFSYYLGTFLTSTINQLTNNNFGNMKIVFCKNKEEQQQIVDYLDKKVADIDLIIEKTKATIEDYKKYKQSIITEVVTKGLNPNVEMKDSEIKWIGKIPKHWTLKKFRNILIERNEKNIPIKTSERLSLSIDKGVTLYSEKTTNLDRFKEDVSQYKIAHINDLVLNSMNMIVGAVGVSKYFGCVSPVYYTYYDKIKNSPTPKFCNYLFSSKTIKKVLFSLGRGIMAIDRGDDKINTCRLKISRDDLRSLIFPIPSLEEQQQIVDYLDKKIAEIDNLIAKKESLIGEMEEYKKSLIYECVTGKKEIV